MSLLLLTDSGGVDPSRWSLVQKLAIRGAMWTARCNLPMGPRPGQDSNILAMDYYEWYQHSDQQKMLAGYLSCGYTHAVTGPMVDVDGYHGLYPTMPRLPTQLEWDTYLDCMQVWWNHGIAPIHFVHPDNWSFDDMQALLPLYRQARARKLLPIKVWTGWEPTRYSWSNAYWNQFLDQACTEFPEDVHLVHTVTDVDALTGDGDNLPKGNATAWQRSAPYLHGWLCQFGGYFQPIENRENVLWPAQYADFQRNMPALFSNTSHASYAQRFRQGYAGWPTGSVMGSNVPMKLYAGEYAAYPDFWWDWPEQESRQLGSAAIAAGADGSLDGCFPQ